MFSQKFIFIFIFEYPLRIISELIKISVDTLIEYYTDEHNVDEDRVTITSQGGRWCELSTVGVSDRYIWNSPSSPSPNVASLKNIGHS